MVQRDAHESVGGDLVRQRFDCGHCGTSQPAVTYAPHVKACIADKISNWDEGEYSRRYYAQVRAISRFSQPGGKRRRSMYRAWGWWTLRSDGPPLMSAEVSG